MTWVVEGLAECAAIDSTVLEQLGNFPQLSTHLRIIDTIGSCPMLPVFAAQRLG